jgi:hypothetical protein
MPVAGKGSIEASAITPSKNQVISSSFDQVVGGEGVKAWLIVGDDAG